MASLTPQADVLEREVLDPEKMASVDGVGERLNKGTLVAVPLVRSHTHTAQSLPV